MAEPWVILGRIPRVATDDAEAGHDADADADFFVPVALPPRVTVLTAARSAHPDRERPDTYPYILAAGPECLLVHFSAKPFCGAHFGVNPHESYLVLSRRFRMAAGEITASAERVSDRPVSMPAIRNIQSIGLVPCDLGRGYMIADLQVDKGSDRAKLLRFQSGRDQWFETDLRCPLDAQDREWVPEGVVSLDHKFWWFDLSWGILSCDPFVADPELLFHGLPQGRDLDMAGPDIHDHRCITVSQNELRYVEVTPEVDDVGEAATVFMWTWTPALDGRTGRWEVAYEMSFAEIWNDDSYHLTGLPEKVPVLAVVCPSNPNLVYFALDHHLFGVNMPLHTVVELETYELVTTACPTTASCRYVLAWDLPPCVATGLLFKEEKAHEVDEVAFAYAKFCCKREEALEGKKDIEVCHICYFREGKIARVSKTKMEDHCFKFHTTPGFPCKKQGCFIRTATLGDAGLHHHYCHGHKSRVWWRRYLEEHGHA